jgi:hypothetical protein
MGVINITWTIIKRFDMLEAQCMLAADYNSIESLEDKRGATLEPTTWGGL